jgi:hypothetical protein
MMQGVTKRGVTATLVAALAAALLLLAVSAWSGGVAGAQASTPEASTPKGDNGQGDNDQGGTTAENRGTVYSLTNDPERNQVVAHGRQGHRVFREQQHHAPAGQLHGTVLAGAPRRR